MTNKEFKIWLATNEHTQRTLAAKLGINENTIGKYVRNESFPMVFVYALKGIAAEAV